MSFAWILFAIVHVALIGNLIKIESTGTDELLVGASIVSKDPNNATAQ